MISICIPAYEMQGRGVEMLRELIASIRMQSFADYEIVVSDDGGVERLVQEMSPSWYPNDGHPDSIFGARLVKGKPGAAANLNNAIDHARGDIIKPMFQDDQFLEPDTLQKIADVFQDRDLFWLACTSRNVGESGFRDDTHVPYPHNSLEALRQGENTYGSPSAMAWRRNDLRFDVNLHWLFDCEFYARMAERYGVPAFVDTPIFIRQWSGMATLIVATGEQRIADTNYVIEKYG
jgi:glycosyltransferase involved in cell wall biosynthesis